MTYVWIIGILSLLSCFGGGVKTVFAKGNEIHILCTGEKSKLPAGRNFNDLEYAGKLKIYESFNFFSGNKKLGERLPQNSRKRRRSKKGRNSPAAARCNMVLPI